MASKSSEALLPSFKQVSPAVYIQSSLIRSNGPPGKPKTPDIILLLSWVGANKAHIAKYIPDYMALYPNARITLITSAPTDFLFGNRASQRNQLKLVVDVLAAEYKATVLVHLLSNGGSHTLWRLAKMYKETQGCLLPMNALIFDSGPGKMDFDRVAAVLSLDLPKGRYLRLPGLCLVYMYLCFLWAMGALSIIDHVWHGLNGPDLIDPNAVRCYIYSKRDVMVWWKDVEDHADEAEARGCKVKKELFQGEHVAHMRSDRGRYWKVVGNVWDMASQKIQ
ncbi:hypothetical protein MMC30_001928 [Trapelia coarctata]|nr:hypothetical protein [Trapelia coarctata]